MQSRFHYSTLTIIVVMTLSFYVNANSIPGFYFQCGDMHGADILQCDGETVIITSPDGGNVTLQPGEGGHVLIGDSILSEDVVQHYQTLASSPPIWTKHFNGGNLGVYGAYSDVSISIGAEDPEGGSITYSVLSGTLPLGLELDSETGKINGTAPGFQALFSFSVQATDEDGRTTAAVFTIDILESYYHCSGDPCENNGTCVDSVGGGFYCYCPEGYYGETCQFPCPSGYGGSDCSDYCLNTALGVSNSNIITNDQMTAQSVYSSYYAYNGRLNYGSYWRPYSPYDWLQIDFINLVEVYKVATQGTGSYGVTRYYLYYSNGGRSFTVYTYNGSSYQFYGSTSSSAYYSSLPAPVKLTHIRFDPTSVTSYAYLHVEVYGCYV